MCESERSGSTFWTRRKWPSAVTSQGLHSSAAAIDVAVRAAVGGWRRVARAIGIRAGEIATLATVLAPDEAG